MTIEGFDCNLNNNSEKEKNKQHIDHYPNLDNNKINNVTQNQHAPIKATNMNSIVNDENDGNDDSIRTGFHIIKSWHNQELIELHTIAWRLGMKISHQYGSEQLEDPTHYGLMQNHFDLSHLYSN